MSECSKSKCCKSKCSNEKRSSRFAFLGTLLVIVAIGGGLYTYLDATVFAPTEAQEQTALFNPGIHRAPRSKMNAHRTDTTIIGAKAAPSTGDPARPSTNASGPDQ